MNTDIKRGALENEGNVVLTIQERSIMHERERYVWKITNSIVTWPSCLKDTEDSFRF